MVSVCFFCFSKGMKIDDISSRISKDVLQAKSLEHNFMAVLQTMEKLRKILRNFNDDVETVFDNFAVGPSIENRNTPVTEGVPLSRVMSPLNSDSDVESLPPAPETYSFPSMLPSISHSIESVYSFTSDVCNYRCGVFGTCEITHIIDPVECICCMVDSERYVYNMNIGYTALSMEFSFHSLDVWCNTHTCLQNFRFLSFSVSLFSVIFLFNAFSQKCVVEIVRALAFAVDPIGWFTSTERDIWHRNQFANCSCNICAATWPGTFGTLNALTTHWHIVCASII